MSVHPGAAILPRLRRGVLRQAPDGGRRRELQLRMGCGGAAALDDIELLELLCGASPAAAGALLATFGSLPEVWGAPLPDLSRVAGPACAVRVTLAHELAARALLRPLKRRDVLSSWSALLAYLRTVLVGAPREQFRVIFLNKRNAILADEVMGVGSIDHAPVYPREVMRRALELNAAALILAHNHPGGDPTPSSADIEMTRQLTSAARALSIAIHDHVIVAGEQVASLRALGLL